MIELEILSGHIKTAINDAIAASAENGGALVGFEFNGIKVRVDHLSEPALIYRDWERAMAGCVPDKIVGPHPAAELSEREKALDAEVRAENERRWRKADEKRRHENEARKALLLDALSQSPALSLTDAAGWQATVENNQDPYGKAGVTFAERWARLMQARIESGDQLADVADECCSLADLEGITGFMYGCAVSILSQCWLHGEDLRRWHNLKTQIGSEGEKANESGGVLNPALLSIGN